MYAKYLLIGALLIGSGSAWAHEAKGTHGGRIADAGSYHVEMVVKSDVVDVFITDTVEIQTVLAWHKTTTTTVQPAALISTNFTKMLIL